MTQNPYATPSQPHQPFGSDPWLDTPADQRVSVLAVVSLVCGILCFIPVVGTIGVVLGIASLFLIAGSQRRLTGKGLAIAGIVLGMLGTVAWGGIVIGFSQMATIAGRDVVVPAAGAMTLIESGKSDELKKYFAPDVAARLTPEHVEAFRTAYTTELGAYVGSPDSAVSMFRSYFDSNVAARFEEFGVIQKRDEEIVPLTGEFQNIKTLLLFEAPDNAWDGSKPRTTDPDAFPWPLQNIGVLTGSGVEIWLLPELKPAPALPPAPSKPAPAEAPGEPESEPTEPAVPEEPK